MSYFKWYRKWQGGIWHYNRYWFDAGTTVIWVWERKFLGYSGGPRCTQNMEMYKKN